MLKRNLHKNHLHTTRLPNTAILFLIAAPFVIVYYAAYVFNPAHIQNLVLYILQVIADSIAILVMMSLWLTILLDVIVEEHHRIKTAVSPEFIKAGKPSIDAFITVAGEPFEVVSQTMHAVIKMEYPHKTFVLDDGKSEQVKKLAQELGIVYITRTGREFAKSGNLNNGLKYSHSEYFCVFDADQQPKPDFITKLLPYMADTDLAMVQSPQHFKNTDYFISAGTAQAQDVFYQYICPAKNSSDSVFCVGTNMIFRRAAINEIGGIAMVSHSEDIWTSRQLHEAGWKTLFINEILAIGEAPTRISSYFKQQLRWAKGGLSMLFLHNSFGSKKLTIDQKLQYFFANVFYLVGFSIIVYLVLPILYLLFGISPLHVTSSVEWLSHYVPYFLLYYSLTWLLLGRLRLATIATSLASFYPYILAFITAVFGTKLNWTPTTSQRGRSEVIMSWIWPHLLLIFVSLFALIVGWFEPSDVPNTVINSIWVSWNMYLLLIFVTGERRRVGL